MSECESFGAASPVAPSDTAVLSPIPDAIYVGTGGTITGRLRDSSADTVFKNIPNAAELDYAFQYIRTTGTTAADMVALYKSATVAAALATPTLSNFSALGAVPIVLQMSTTDYVAGLRGQLQVATNAAFTSPSQNFVFFIDGDSWARLDEAVGLVSPSGTYYARVRILRDNENGSTTVTDQLNNTFVCDASSWSNTFTDTINVASTVWSSTTKSQYVAVSGSPALTATGSGGVNAAENVFGTATKTGKRWFEVTLTTIDAGARVMIGFDNNTRSGTVNFFEPGNGNTEGACLVINGNGIYSNGSLAQSSPANGSGQQGDAFRCEIDDVAHTVAFFRIRAGSQAQVGATQSIPAISPYRACAAPYSPSTSNVINGNFGQSSSAGAPTAGFNPYG